MIKYLKENFSFIIRMFKQDKSLNQRQKNRAGVTFFISLFIVIMAYTTIFEATCRACLTSIDVGASSAFNDEGIVKYDNAIMGIACKLRHGGGIPDCKL